MRLLVYLTSGPGYAFGSNILNDTLDSRSLLFTSILLFCLQAKLETKALKAKRPGFTDERYNETSYYIENGKSEIGFLRDSVVVDRQLSGVMYVWAVMMGLGKVVESNSYLHCNAR